VRAVALELCEKYGTMAVYGIRMLVTENKRDFDGITEVRAVNPVASSSSAAGR
jgi:hypothetical protein